MMKISKNKLSVVGVRFAFPEDFYVDIEGMECIHPDGLRFISAK